MNSAKGIATAGIWIGMAFIVYFTKSAEVVGWAVGATFIVWFFG
jgi:hypothetical protein